LFKVACIIYKVITTGQPSYLRTSLQYYTPGYTRLDWTGFVGLGPAACVCGRLLQPCADAVRTANCPSICPG